MREQKRSKKRGALPSCASAATRESCGLLYFFLLVPRLVYRSSKATGARCAGSKKSLFFLDDDDDEKSRQNEKLVFFRPSRLLCFPR